MVLDAAFYASTVTSLMMNGVCCVWQMQQEEEQRASFRQDIRAEYERQREEEFKMWEKHQSFYCSDGDSSTFSSSLSPHSEPYMLREKVVREKMNLSARMHRRESDAWEANTRRTVSTSPPRRLPLRVPMMPASPLKNHRFAAQHAFPANEQQEEEAPREQPPQLIEETNINHKNYHNTQGFLQHHEQQPQNPSLSYCPRYPSSSRTSHQQQVNQEEPPSLMDLDDEEARDEVTETTSMVSVAIQ